jgi:hypothetical protein
LIPRSSDQLKSRKILRASRISSLSKPDEPPHLLGSHAGACLARGPEIVEEDFLAGPLELYQK